MPKRTHRLFSQNSPSLPQNSLSSLFQNSTLETVFRLIPKSAGQSIMVLSDEWPNRPGLKGICHTRLFLVTKAHKHGFMKRKPPERKTTHPHVPTNQGESSEFLCENRHIHNGSCAHVVFVNGFVLERVLFEKGSSREVHLPEVLEIFGHSTSFVMNTFPFPILG